MNRFKTFLVLLTFVGLSFSAMAQTYTYTPNFYTSYMDENGVMCYINAHQTTAVTQTMGNSGTTYYILRNTPTFTTFTGTLTINGTVHLILEDSCNWTINSGGIRVTGSNSLIICAQSTGSSMGRLTANGGDHSAGIGGAAGNAGGIIIINGGNIKATGANATNGSGSSAGYGGGAGIGGGGSSSGGNIIINGGIIEAIGGKGGNGGPSAVAGGTGKGGGGAGAGIGGGGGGGGEHASSGSIGGTGANVFIKGGQIAATGGNNGNSGGMTGGWGHGGGGGGGGAGASIGGGGGGGGGGQGGGSIFGSNSGGSNGNSGGNIGRGGNGGSGGHGSGGADVYPSGGSGGNSGTNTIDGGSIKTSGNDTFTIIINSESQNVYLNTLTTLPPQYNATVTEGTINNVALADIPNAASGVYGKRDVRTDATSKLYFYLPCYPNGSTKNISATIGGVVFNTASYSCATDHGIAQNLTVASITLTQSNPTAALCVGATPSGRVPITITAPSTSSVTIQSSNLISGSDPSLYNNNTSTTSGRIADDEAGNAHWSYNIPAGQTMTVYAGTYSNGAACYTVTAYFSPTILYVRPTSYGSGNGLSWTNASGNIQNMINISSSGDQIWIASGTYLLSETLIIKEGVNVYGGFAGTESDTSQRVRSDLDANGIIEPWEFTNATVLDGNNARQVLNQASNFTIETVWDGVTITRGRILPSGVGGGAVIRVGGKLANCIVRNNSLSGGIYNNGTIINCMIRSNTSSYSGGGINNLGSGIITNCILHDNRSEGSGGGIYNSGGGIITNCILTNNRSFGRSGGGIYNFSGGVITNCIINGNTAYDTYDYQRSFGGGVYNLEGIIDNCIVSGNTASSSGSPSCPGCGVYSYGGGIYNSGGTITNSTISGNKANSYFSSGYSVYSYGGGIYNGGGTITNCTINENQASSSIDSYGGGIYNSGNVYNCIIQENSSREGGGLYAEVTSIASNCLIVNNNASSSGGGSYTTVVNSFTNCTFVNNTATTQGGGIFTNSSYVTVTNCVFWGNSASTGYQIQGNSSTVTYSAVQGGRAGTGNINLAAQNDAASGPKFIDPINGDYQLQACSPCINSGSNAALAEADTLDLNSSPRIYGDIVDMGAYELQEYANIPTVSITGSSSICVGLTTQLSPTTGGTWISNNPSVASVSSSGLVTGLTGGTATFTFTNNTAPYCQATTLAVTVNALPTVSITGSNPICVNATTQLSPMIGGTWISNNPTVASVNNVGTVTGLSNGTVTFTFTYSTTGCPNTTQPATINPNITPTFTGIETEYCAGASIPALPTTSNNGITGTWSPPINHNVTTTYTFTPTAGQCVTTPPVTIEIAINQNVTPTFNIEQTEYCAGATIPALPTTSNNDITGTWSPPINNNTTTTYTFNPTAGQCVTTTPITVTIEITQNLTPTFTGIETEYCAGATIPALPTTSYNSITGTWSPPINNNATTTYTFSPTAGQCVTSTPVTVTIEITQNLTPTFTGIETDYCAGATIPALPTTSNNGITGTWSPSINNNATTTYTFSPAAGQCVTSTPVTVTIEITPNVTPTFTGIETGYCAGATIPALPIISNNGITGTWSPSIDNNVTTTYTFNPTAGQCATTPPQITIEITQNVTPEFSGIVTEYPAGAYIPPLPLLSNNGISGTWAPEINNMATTKYTFTPTAGQCATTANIEIRITVGIDDSLSNQLQIFPNPTHTELFIKTDLQIEKVEIYSIIGTLLLSENNFKEKISVSALPTGIYFLKVYTDKGMVVSKVVKE